MNGLKALLYRGTPALSVAISSFFAVDTAKGGVESSNSRCNGGGS